MDYRDLEGVLYGLRQRSEARYSRPAHRPTRTNPGPRMLLNASAERRVDVTYGLETLSSQERQLLTEHYSGLRTHPPRVRRPVIKKLLRVLAGPRSA